MKTNDCELTTNKGENEHKITIYGCVTNSKNGFVEDFTLQEIYERFDYFCEKAESFDVESDDELKQYKRNRLPAFVYADLEGGVRDGACFNGRSLLSIDIDQKGFEKIFTYEDMKKLLKELNLNSVIHTSISHTPSFPCYRIIIDIGEVCDEARFKVYTEWFKKKLPDIAMFDTASSVATQAMLIPFAYINSRPETHYIEGDSIRDQYQNEVNAIVLPGHNPKVRKKTIRKLIVSCSTATERFNTHVHYLHKPLIFDLKTQQSSQYFRNTADKHPSLFCMDNMRVVIDRKFDKKYPLFYSYEDFYEAEYHTLPSRDDVVSELLSWMSSDVKHAVLREVCGSGKSQSLLKLTSEDPSAQQQIHTFHTIANRDAFAENALNSEVVLGNTELIELVVTNETKRNDIAKRIADIYEASNKLISDYEKQMDSMTHGKGILRKEIAETMNDVMFIKVLDDCQQTGLITKSQKNAIVREHRGNKNKLQSSKHLIMTTAKLEYLVTFSDEGRFDDYAVFTDEVTPGCLTTIPDEARKKVYGKYREIENDSVIKKSRMRDLKQCFVTVEMFIEHELDNNNLAFTRISGVSKTYDDNFEVLLVPSTSHNKYKHGKKTPRQKYFDSIKKVYGEDVNIIADGFKEDGHTLNHVNNKGRNDLSDKTVVVILSKPHPSNLARFMYITGLDEHDAMELLMSDQAVQAIGRNQGYRNKDNGIPSKGDNKCLLICPDSVDLDMHNVTSKVVNIEKWNTKHKEFIDIVHRSNFNFAELYNELTGCIDEAVKLQESIDRYRMDNPAVTSVPVKKLDMFERCTVSRINRVAVASGYEVTRGRFDGRLQSLIQLKGR